MQWNASAYHERSCLHIGCLFQGGNTFHTKGISRTIIVIRVTQTEM